MYLMCITRYVRVNWCVHVFISMCVYARDSSYVCTHTIRVSAQCGVCVHLPMNALVCLRPCVCISTDKYVSVYMYGCVCRYGCVCMRVYRFCFCLFVCCFTPQPQYFSYIMAVIYDI